MEASAFYALSLVALAEEGVDGTANRKKAIAILKPLFKAHPDSPGVAHYLIHASDAAQLANEGLAAARAYAKIAPDFARAAHAVTHFHAAGIVAGVDRIEYRGECGSGARYGNACNGIALPDVRDGVSG